MMGSVNAVRMLAACETACLLHAAGILMHASSCMARLLEEARPVLEPAASTGKSPALCAAAAEALSLLAFVGSEDPAATDAVMKALAALSGAGAGQ